MTVPYQDATSGSRAREEITKLLRRLGCERIGFMDDFESSEVILAFTHRQRNLEMRASAKGWASMFLREQPYGRHKCTKAEYEARAMRQGLSAVNSILRDWVKGQVVAIECGILSFEEVFIGQILLADGSKLFDQAQKMLPGVRP